MKFTKAILGAFVPCFVAEYFGEAYRRIIPEFFSRVARTLQVGTSSRSTEIDYEGVTREPPSQNPAATDDDDAAANVASAADFVAAPLPCQSRGAAPPGSPGKYRKTTQLNLRLRLKKCKKKHKGIVLKMKKRLWLDALRK